MHNYIALLTWLKRLGGLLGPRWRQGRGGAPVRPTSEPPLWTYFIPNPTIPSRWADDPAQFR